MTFMFPCFPLELPYAKPTAELIRAEVCTPVAQLSAVTLQAQDGKQRENHLPFWACSFEDSNLSNGTYQERQDLLICSSNIRNR